jgi:anti-anti-sigma factor
MTTQGGVVVVDLDGELELATIDRVEALLGEVDDDANVVVDLRRTTFLDSATLARFIGAARRQAAGGGRLVLAEARASTVRRVLSITQMDRVLPYAETVDEAVALLTAGSAPAPPTGDGSTADS